MRLKKNDTVKIITGKDKGKTGRIVKCEPKKERVYVQGCNMIKKAVKKKTTQDKGGIIEVEGPIHISNVALLVKGGQTSRVGYKMVDGKKVRYAKKTGEVL